ncbi:MAG: right-handed parallel beta-helix repeat-containing protein, partial [Chloroflexota bacterium]
MQSKIFFSRVMYFFSAIALIAQLIIPVGAAKAAGENIWWCPGTDTPAGSSCISSVLFDTTFKNALKAKSGDGILYLGKTSLSDTNFTSLYRSTYTNLGKLTIQGGWTGTGLSGNSTLTKNIYMEWNYPVTINNLTITGITADYAMDVRTYDTAGVPSDININFLNIYKNIHHGARLRNSDTGAVTVKDSVIGADTQADGNAGRGLEFWEMGTGAVLVENVTAHYNGGMGLIYGGAGDDGLTIKNSTFNHNGYTGDNGMYVYIFNGNVIVDSVTASNNGDGSSGTGLEISGVEPVDPCPLSVCKAVTIKNSTFSENGLNGVDIQIETGKLADIILEGVTADKNIARGAILKNSNKSTGNISVKPSATNSSTFGALISGVGVLGNGKAGLDINTNGTTEIFDTKVNNNNNSGNPDASGLLITHPASHVVDIMDITMDKGEYNYNNSAGIYLSGTDSTAKLTNMEIGNNDGIGIIDTQGGELSLGDCDFNYHDNRDDNDPSLMPVDVTYTY